MGGDHGHGKLSMPDHKLWKWEGTPLEATQQRLARRGLRDPWARQDPFSLEKAILWIEDLYFIDGLEWNEAWRYTGSFGVPVTFPNVLLRGFKTGFAAFVVALAVEYAFFPPKKSEH